MSNILVTYATKSGSTQEIAQSISQTLGENGASVDLKPMRDVQHLRDYDTVVIGAPMIKGWHPGALQWVTQHQSCLRKKQTALFITCVSLTQTDANSVTGIPIYLDPKVGKPPRNPNRLRFKERYAQPTAYLQPILDAVPQVKPVSVGFFGGKLDYSTLDLKPRLFVRFVVRGVAGDYRNWAAIETWATHLREQFSAN